MQEPTFNLKAVVQETGLKPDTLRAWERRYGLPKPKRSAGGHRLYSRQDIAILKWLVARQAEGLSISRAIDMWRKLEARGRNPLRGETGALPQPPPAFVSGETITELRQSWISACLAFEEQAAEQILSQAFALYPLKTVCFELLQKGMSAIGTGWVEGETTVQQEHFASTLAIRRLHALIAAAPEPTRSERILVGGAPQEQHIFGLLLLAFLLRRQGLNVIYLGADLPGQNMNETVTEIEPDLIVTAAYSLPTAANLVDLANLLRQENISLSFGGEIFNQLPHLRSRIFGHFLGEKLVQAVSAVERLLELHPPIAPVIAPSPPYREALSLYQKNQAAIEAAVSQALAPFPGDLAYANLIMARHIEAALRLGDITALSKMEDQLKMLLRPHLSSKQIDPFLNMYYKAIQSIMGEPGQLILSGFVNMK